MAGQWFSPGTLVSSTNKTDRHNINEILLKVALNTINHNLIYFSLIFMKTQQVILNYVNCSKNIQSFPHFTED